MKTITMQCELVVHVEEDSNMKELVKSIREESINCWGVWTAKYGYEIKKIQKIKIDNY